MKVTCTWGDGPDILLTLDGTPFVCHETPTDFSHWAHGVIRQGSTDLTLAEAKDLVAQLLCAISAVESLEASVEEYFSHEENR